ncbi:MAG: MbnP family protein [Bacteroidota bacterium]
MKNILFLLSISTLFLAASCGKEPPIPVNTAELNLSFKATYDGEPLVLNQQTYRYATGPVRFSKINFYIADLVAVNNDGETELSEIRFIDLTKSHNTPLESSQGTVVNFSKVPVGVYNQLKFGVGVPADLNKTNPSDYSTTHPLGADNSGEYWEAWNSYIFMKVEGQWDANDDGFDVDDINFAYHVGGRDALYEPVEQDNSLNLRAGETTNLTFELDVKTLFTFPDDGTLLRLEPHDPNSQVAEMFFLMNNLKRALILK